MTIRNPVKQTTITVPTNCTNNPLENVLSITVTYLERNEITFRVYFEFLLLLLLSLIRKNERKPMITRCKFRQASNFELMG